jgi:hypothetical protein
MRQVILAGMLLFTVASSHVAAQTQSLDFSKVKAFEHQLDDVMELTDTNAIKRILNTIETAWQQNPTEINAARLGILYHEVALNLSFFSQSAYKGYAPKSYDRLSTLFNAPNTTRELYPFIASYRASALALTSGETRKLKLLGEAFDQFKAAVEAYASVSYLPEFLRGSVAENLPWFFFSKRKAAKRDFQSIIDKQEKNNAYATPKIMSFTYWAWANQHKGKKHRAKALLYLQKATQADPDYQAGRAKAEALQQVLAQ